MMLKLSNVHERMSYFSLRSLRALRETQANREKLESMTLFCSMYLGCFHLDLNRFSFDVCL